jgi:Mg/Co/Ni transporter MgtE
MQKLKEIMQKDVTKASATELATTTITGIILGYGIFCVIRYIFF